jgi:DNA-binding transcriptional regulator YiaG
MSLPIPGQTKTEEHLTIKELLDFMRTYGMSTQEFADTIGVTIQAVNLWIKGERDISLTTTRLVRLLTKYPQLIREFGKC